MATTTSVAIKLILLSVSFTYFIPSSADDLNYSTGRSCSEKPDNSTTSPFKTNLNTLLSILETEAPRNYGFYKTTTGEKSDTLYGLVQCRGDVSAQNCATCIRDSINKTLVNCKNSEYGAFWLRWCCLHYSNINFFGQFDGMSVGQASYNSTFDDPTVVSKGMRLMSQLTADVPNHPFMFKTGSVSVGQKQNRYGLVQCNRDLSKSICGDCLSSILQAFNKQIDNQSSYSVISNGCRMTYERYEFYFNYSLPTSGSPSPMSASQTGLQISLVTVTVMFISILIPWPII